MDPSRTCRSLSALMLAMVVSVWLAPSAHAQLSGTLEETAGTVEETVGNTDTGSVVGGITDALEGDSSGAGSGNEETPGDGDLIGGVVDKIDKTIDEGKETVTEVTETTGDTLGKAGAGTVGGIVGTVEGTVGKVGNGDKDGKQRKDARTSTNGGNALFGDTSLVLSSSLADALRADSKNIESSFSADTSGITAPASTSEDSLVQQIGRIAAEAVKNAAFPLALILLVGGFLVVQNRIDRRDPKLALAPVDPEHDLLSFS